MAKSICVGCGFGPGLRTGDIHTYEIVSAGTDFLIGQRLDLCDDCVSHAPTNGYGRSVVQKVCKVNACPNHANGLWGGSAVGWNTLCDS